jgi:hypothetical protein
MIYVDPILELGVSPDRDAKIYVYTFAYDAIGSYMRTLSYLGLMPYLGAGANASLR